MKSLVEWMQAVRLPVMPEVAAKLVSSYQDEHVEITYLRDVIAKDPVLTAALLRLANSPLHGLSRTVNSLDAAISLLGITKVRTQAIAVCLSDSFDLPQGMSRQDFWNKSMQCAGYAMWLALAVGLDESEAWLTGMLLHLGEILISQQMTLETAAAEPPSNATLNRWQMQQAEAGFDEGQVMAAAATQWYFPPSIVQALQHCANPLEADTFYAPAAVVHLAAMLADLEGVDEARLGSLPAEVVTRLGIELPWLAQHIPDPRTFTDTSIL